jgi:hypothetical protein
VTLPEARVWAEFDVTPIVQAWVEGRNNGLILKAFGGGVFYFASSEWPEFPFRPMLTVVYRPTTSSSSNNPVTPTRRIEVEYPPKMNKGDSYTIRLSLISVKEEICTPVVEPRYTIEVATPKPEGTPGVPLEKRFGEQYNLVRASAKMTTVGFEFKLHDPETQPVDDEVHWRWGITPKESGEKEVILSLFAHWKGPSPPEITRQIWSTDPPLKISVQEPWLTKGQINILVILSSFLGSALDIPWLYERWKEHRERRRGRP